jgi:hypothetical protein
LVLLLTPIDLLAAADRQQRFEIAPGNILTNELDMPIGNDGVESAGVIR